MSHRITSSLTTPFLSIRTTRQAFSFPKRRFLAPFWSSNFSTKAQASPMASTLNFFDIEKLGNGVAVVTLEDKTNKVNTLSSRMLSDFSRMVQTIESDSSIESVVFLSGKKDSFIVGADITELSKVTTPAEGEQLSKNGQDYLDLLAKSNVNYVCAIHGPCLGGGLEFALACDYRIATGSKKTQIGLPEVKLGLLPGAGGTQRLPRLIGIQNAIKLITTGSSLNAERAMKMGLIDEVADDYALKSAAILAAETLARGKKSKKKSSALPFGLNLDVLGMGSSNGNGRKALLKKKKFNIMTFALEGNPLGRTILFDQATKIANKTTGGNYPAVDLILKTIKSGFDGGFDAGLKTERESFGKLTITNESKCLQNIFFASTKLKKNQFQTSEMKTKFADFEKRKKTVGVLGAGLMGAGITQVSASNGYNVVVKDLNLNAIKRGEEQIMKNLDESVKKRKLSKYDQDTILSNIDFVSTDYFGDDYVNKKVSKCDYVIEAVLEDLKLKHRVINDLEKVVSKDCVVATNTSALFVRDIAAGISNKEFAKNLIGMHYFSPVDKMPLLEIIPYDGTSEETKYKAVQLGLAQKKTVIVVKDVPGFYVNRCLGPYLSEVTELIKSGVDIADIDKIMKKYGFPVGPISLIDEVGLDVALHVQTSLAADLNVRMSDAALLEALVKKGNLGRKSGKGFFVYQKEKAKSEKGKEVAAQAKEVIKQYSGKSIAPASKSSSQGKEGRSNEEVQKLQERMAFKFINEAILCLQDQVIRNHEDGDIGAVFGVGFPPFRGGPFKEVDRIGSTAFVDKMKKMRDEYGPGFTPAQLVVDMAKENKKFYGS